MYINDYDWMNEWYEFRQRREAFNRGHHVAVDVSCPVSTNNTVAWQQVIILTYCMSKKSVRFIYSELPYENGQEFFDIH